jgi:hypothetical protein
MTIEEIEREITFERTIEVRSGQYSKLQHVRVQPSDIYGYDATEAELADPEQRAWWTERCRLEGEIHCLFETSTREQLDSIAERAGRIDWTYAMDQIGDASNDDAIMAIQSELAAASWSI